MILTGDYHTHTVFSHGKGSILQNAQAAAEKNLKVIAITDHGFNHPCFGMKRKELPEMQSECEKAEQETGVRVILGVEANILGVDGKLDVKENDYKYIKLIVAGAHVFVGGAKFNDYFRFFGENFLVDKLKIKPKDKLIKNTTRAYINAIEKNPIDIISHVGFRYACDPIAVAECAAEHGTYIEINTKKRHLSDEQWQEVFKTNCRFLIDSDAHSTDRVGDTNLFSQLCERISVPLDRIDNIDGRQPKFRNCKG